LGAILDIHKPHAAKSWREFFTEIGTIVLGILIALGLEQAVVAIRDGRSAAEADANIRAEIAQGLGTAQARLTTEPCMARRLDEIAKILAQPLGTDLPRPLWVGRPQTWGFFDGQWQAATASGRASLLQQDKLAAYTNIYAHLRGVYGNEHDELVAWAQLRGLERLRSLDAASLAAMTTALQQASSADWEIRLQDTSALEFAADVGVKPSPTKGSRSVCIPLSTPRQKALQQIRDPFGEPL
jgi:hypothetical protein